MPATLSAPIKHAAAKATLDLPFHIPAKEWFSLAECATIAGVSESFAEKKFDEGQILSGHVHNGAAGMRMTKKVPRTWLIVWLLSTAHYCDQDIGDAFVSCLPRLPAATLRRIANVAARFAGEKEPEKISGAAPTKSPHAASAPRG